MSPPFVWCFVLLGYALFSRFFVTASHVADFTRNRRSVVIFVGRFARGFPFGASTLIVILGLVDITINEGNRLQQNAVFDDLDIEEIILPDIEFFADVARKCDLRGATYPNERHNPLILNAIPNLAGAQCRPSCL